MQTQSKLSSSPSPIGSSVPQLKGVILALVVGSAAYFAGNLIPLIGGAVIALVLGIGIRLAWQIRSDFQPGLKLCQKQMLQAAIVLMGTGFTVSRIWTAGRSAMPVILISVLIGLLLIPLAGRFLRMGKKVSELVAAGTAICGASAIGAVAPVIGASTAEVAYAISTIFFFNTVAVLIYPLLGHLTGLTDWMFGVWAGTAIHDTSSVVAAAYAFSDQAGEHATVVKLARTTMLLPVLIMFGVRSGEGEFSFRSVFKSFPLFILWFMGAAAINSAGLIPVIIAPGLKFLSKFLLVVALAAVGMNTDFKTVQKIGLRPMALGFGASVLIGGVSWVLIRFI